MKILILVLSFIFAGQLAQPYALTDQERQQWAQFAQAEQQQQQALQQIIGQAASFSVEPQNSMQIHAALQKTALEARLIGEQRRAWLAQLQLDHDCKGCVVQDGKLAKSK